MLRLLRSKKAQNTMEYALLIAVVIGAFTAMQLYMRRSVNVRVKQGMDNAVDAIKSQVNLTELTNATVLFPNNAAHQYEPYYYREGSSNMSTASSEGTERATMTGTDNGTAGGIREVANATTQRYGNQSLSGFNASLYNWTYD
ncbi:MAG: hypothetical protein ABSB18_07875 [Candidatus Omnitrophota bacterium]